MRADLGGQLTYLGSEMNMVSRDSSLGFRRRDGQWDRGHLVDR